MQNMKRWLCVVGLSSMVLLAGCQNNQETGILAGGAAGALLGSSVGNGSGRGVAMITGAVLGSYFGSQIGRSMDEVDRMKMHNATVNALNADQERYWSTNHAEGYVRPNQQHVHGQDGERCRSFHTSVKMDGQEHWTRAQGCACRFPGEAWQMVRQSRCQSGQ